MDWETVYWTQMPRIYNFFRYRTGDNQIAQDLTATTFEKAWKHREQYRCDLGLFEQWLFGIARRVAIDFLREQRPPPLSLDEVNDLSAEGSVEQMTEQRWDFARLSLLLRDLPPRDQELIALKYGAGLTNRAIADVMQLSESNVGTLLYRLIQKLRAEWEKDHAR